MTELVYESEKGEVP